MFNKKPNQDRLRKCQKEAYANLLAHYAKSDANRRVLIQLPTGTGKSVLVAITPFELCRQKALIITPNIRLVEQIRDDLDLQSSSNKYDNLNLFSKQQLEELKSKLFLLVLDDKANSGDVLENQIIVANFQQLFDLDRWFSECREEVDLIIIDEAHHQAAETYQTIIEYFPDAKVVGLTGTPFRSDGKEVEGRRIYKYSYKDAILDKVIRNFSHHDVMPHEVELVFKDEQKRQYSLNEILKLSDQSWFNNKIYMSQDCCDSIAFKAKEKLEELRASFPEEDHQIIASAMTIKHARTEVKTAFEKLGLRVGLVSSDKLDTPHNDGVLKKLQRNQLDVIINVGMLGEGFDHRPLGVAAIFRPYKSLNPYIQFVGRVIRTNGTCDRAYIVSHAGLNQVRRFKEFKLFDKDEQNFLQDHLFSEGNDTERDQHEKSFVDDDSAENALMDAQLNEVGVNAIETQHVFVESEFLNSLAEQIKKLSESDKLLLDQLIKDQQPNSVDSYRKGVPHPTAKRKASRSRLFEESKTIAMQIARDVGIPQPRKTRTFNPRFNDYAWIIQRVNRKIRKFCEERGVERGQNRKDLRNIDYEKIQELKILDDVKTECVEHFKKSLRERSGD